MIIKCRNFYGDFIYGMMVEPVRALQGPRTVLHRGVFDTPRILVSCRFQKSEIHVFMSIDRMSP
jgi:hypothetical protein